MKPTSREHEGSLLHLLYRGLGAGLYLILLLIRPLVEAAGGRCAYGLGERLGRYPREAVAGEGDPRTVWVHASSVGEVQAAILLVNEMLRIEPGIRVVVTSTTEQGNRLARSRLPATVACLMAPLDLPQAVRRALGLLRPVLYVCLETELWPVMLVEARRVGVGMLLLNGRISPRSFDRYRRLGRYMTFLLQGFEQVAVISDADARRFAALGVAESRLLVCGNMKYDMEADEPERVRRVSRQRLGVSDQTVFLCGSTHEGEEEPLLAVYRRLAGRCAAIWVLAPRHLERLPAIVSMLGRAGAAFDLFSRLPLAGRTAGIVILDTMGDLADLYAGADLVFVGGSLVERGGHNVMEAARWGRPVYFGPHMKDFRDAADLLVSAGGGFQVADAAELSSLLASHLADPDLYRGACLRATESAARQRGAVRRQTTIVRRMLAAG